MKYTVAQIAVENTAYSFDMLYNYLVPERLKDEVKPGCRVMIRFGSSKNERQGVVFSLDEVRESEPAFERRRFRWRV